MSDAASQETEGLGSPADHSAGHVVMQLRITDPDGTQRDVEVIGRIANAQLIVNAPAED